MADRLPSMKDNSEGLELVPTEGQLYSTQKLKQLAEQGADDATKTSKNNRKFVVQFEEGLEGSHAFRVSSSGALPAVYLRVRIDEDSSGLVTRTLETISDPPPTPFDADLQSRELEPLRLGTDASGNPTAYLDDKLLNESLIIKELIEPVRKAVGDI